MAAVGGDLHARDGQKAVARRGEVFRVAAHVVMVGQHAERKARGQIAEHDLRGAVFAVEGVHAVLVQIAREPVGFVELFKRERAQILGLAVRHVHRHGQPFVLRAFGDLHRIFAQRESQRKAAQHIGIHAPEQAVTGENHLRNQPKPCIVRHHTGDRRGFLGLRQRGRRGGKKQQQAAKQGGTQAFAPSVFHSLTRFLASLALPIVAEQGKPPRSGG